MSFLKSIIPTNLNEEKEKFLKDKTYNPQFIYKEVIDQKKLSKYKVAKKNYVPVAEAILKKAYFGRNEKELLLMRGPVVKQKDVENAINTFLKMHRLDKKIKLVSSSSFAVRTSITPKNIKLRLPTNYRKEDLIGMLYHEIGTHALRYVNYEQQPWFKKKKKYDFEDYLITEEGLASLHALIPRSYKSAYTPAMVYLAAVKGQNSSFAQTYQMLNQYIQDPQKCWRVTYRQKRGLEDTSKPGGYAKDLVYLQGIIEVYGWLSKHNFDITNLYFGKMSYKDTKKALDLNPNFIPQLPSFFSLNKEKYAKEIKAIGKFNGFDNID